MGGTICENMTFNGLNYVFTAAVLYIGFVSPVRFLAKEMFILTINKKLKSLCLYKWGLRITVHKP